MLGVSKQLFVFTPTFYKTVIIISPLSFQHSVSDAIPRSNNDGEHSLSFFII